MTTATACFFRYFFQQFLSSHTITYPFFSFLGSREWRIARITMTLVATITVQISGATMPVAELPPAVVVDVENVVFDTLVVVARVTVTVTGAVIVVGVVVVVIHVVSVDNVGIVVIDQDVETEVADAVDVEVCRVADVKVVVV
jgi:hypothetical protein